MILFNYIQDESALRSEDELGTDTGVGNLVGESLEGDNVVTVWCVRWDIPAELEVVGAIDGMAVLWDVSVVEGGSVPVNMDMDVVLGHGVGDNTSEVEGDVGSLGEWLWECGGAGWVEGEDTGIIGAAGEGNISGCFEGVGWCDNLLEEVLGNWDSQEVDWVEDVGGVLHF